MKTIQEVTKMIPILRNFLSKTQLETLANNCRGEEKEFFKEKIAEIFELVSKMPKTYEQDGLGKEAIAYLHYFRGNMDWYIIEKDMGKEQFQAFGYANIGYGYEAGYISIEELKKNNVELDLYFEPKKIKDLELS
jgi:hypothetical protein